MRLQKRTILVLLAGIFFILGIAVSTDAAASENKDSAVFKMRVVEPWHAPDGISIYGHAGNIFTVKDMLSTKPSSPLGRYVAQVRSWGFNHMAMYGDPGKETEAWRNFAHYLKQHGIGMIIRREWCETEDGRSWPVKKTDALPRTSEKLCPYSEATRAYWVDRMERDFQMIPDLAGYRMNGTEFYWINGAPWMCNCAKCKTMTGRERTRDAIRLIADLLKKHGATLFWETSQDDPWGQRQETHYFRDMTGEIPKNAFVLIKYYYWDYRPSYPRHALFDFIKKDANGHSPYMTSIQQPADYRGNYDFPRSMVNDRSKVFRDMAETGQQGVWVMEIVHPDGWDHPLNMVDWYAIERYMKNPYADPEDLRMGWAKEQFGEKAAPVVIKVVDKVSAAAQGMLQFDTLWTGRHGRFPTLEYLDSHLCGPYRQGKRMTRMMGMTWPLDMYTPKRAAEIRSNPKLRLLFNQVEITPKLKAEAMAQKNGAVKLMEESIVLWKGLEGKIDDKIFKKILSGLQGNRDDTKIFSLMMDMYMDWKLGVLTENRIDEILEAARGLKGMIVPNPLDAAPKRTTIAAPASLKTFAEKIRRDLRKPWIEEYWRRHTLGISVTEQIIDPVTGKEWK